MSRRPMPPAMARHQLLRKLRSTKLRKRVPARTKIWRNNFCESAGVGGGRETKSRATISAIRKLQHQTRPEARGPSWGAPTVPEQSAPEIFFSRAFRSPPSRADGIKKLLERGRHLLLGGRRLRGGDSLPMFFFFLTVG